MMKIGSVNRLTVDREANHGLYLTDGETDVLLPRKYVPAGTQVDDEIDVFVTTDSEDRPIATTQQPKGMVGDIVPLRAVQVVKAGAFMDWGLEKDLLVPFSEQHRRMEEGKTYVVMIRLDQASGRVFGTTRLAKFLDVESVDLLLGQVVNIVIADISADAVRAVADGKYFATIFPDEIFEKFQIGDLRRAYVKQIREDGRIALSLSPQGLRAIAEQTPEIVDRLRAAGGFLPFGDRSSPEAIRAEFGLSKGSFKKAIGGLMKSGVIDILDDGIRLRK